jgi:hypothetical protein
LGTRSAFVPHEPVRIYRDDAQPDGDWIAIKPKLGFGDKNILMDVLVKIGSIKSAGETEITAEAGAFQTHLLRLSIVDWNLLGEDGQPVPFAWDKIGQLDPDDELVMKVADEVIRRNPFGRKRNSGNGT